MTDIVDNSIVESIENLPGDLRQGIFNELRNGYQMEAVRSAINNTQISVFNHNAQRKSIDGVGRLRMSIDPTYYHHMAKVYGTYDCWKDESFLRDVEKINPGLKVKCAGTRLQVGYTGSNKKFSKTYNL